MNIQFLVEVDGVKFKKQDGLNSTKSGVTSWTLLNSEGESIVLQVKIQFFKVLESQDEETDVVDGSDEGSLEEEEVDDESDDLIIQVNNTNSAHDDNNLITSNNLVNDSNEGIDLQLTEDENENEEDADHFQLNSEETDQGINKFEFPGKPISKTWNQTHNTTVEDLEENDNDSLESNTPLQKTNRLNLEK